MSTESETYVPSETQEEVFETRTVSRPKGSGGNHTGRPRKTDILAKKKPGKIGRPLGDAAILNEYKARMLNSPKSRKVLTTILNAALDPEHKHQAVAWKLVLDRVAPVAIFDNEVKRAGTGNHISITISGVPTVNIDGGEGGEDEYPSLDQGVQEEAPDEIEAEFEVLDEVVEEDSEGL